MSAPTTGKSRIVLFNPKPWKDGHYYGLPLPLLAVSALPHSKGYPITIVVQDVDDDPEQKVLEACEGALLFGVTSLTGTMIANGLAMCAKVRERYPNLPIVWGGTHPSVAPEQTCEHPLVDIVVAGQGEGTFMNLVETLESGAPLDDVAGICFKRDGKIVKTPPRSTVDIDQLPPMPFELLDMERFIMLHSTALHTKMSGKRGVTYYSSYGCPFSCSFCSEPMTSNRRWYSKSPEKVISELEVLQKQHGVEVIVFEDPIFFIDVKRVKRICELMLERNLKFLWAATSRLETMLKLDESMWELLERTGFMQVFIGIESASPTVLKAVGKKYTADDIVEVARILNKHNVVLTGSFIQGIPVKTQDRSLEDVMREDMRLSAETVLRIYEANPKASVYVVMYTPYPGSVAYHLSLENGLKPPTSLEGWQHFIHENNVVPWILPEQEVFVKSSKIAIKFLRGREHEMRRLHRKKVRGSVMLAYGAITRARYRKGYFKYPVEQHLMHRIAKRVMASRNADGQNRGMLI
jgi:radical SAM superfamily enzyme YgiQ (UPF0313 family)